MKKSYELTQNSIEVYKELRGGIAGIQLLAKTAPDIKSGEMMMLMCDKIIGTLEAIREAQQREAGA